MAYNKKTWKARQGLGLNKFSIDGATPVPIVNQPDSVTQQGDALSAGNLNDLEQRIADAFDDVEESEDVLQSQINQHESRLENLEQKAGDYTIVQYRGTDAVPTGKAKYGLVKSIVGKTRAWNQLVEQTFTSWNNLRRCSVSVNSGTYTVSFSGEGTSLLFSNKYNRVIVPANHKLLFMVDSLDVSNISGTFNVSVIQSNTNSLDYEYTSPIIVSPSIDCYGFGLYGRNLLSGDYFSFKKYAVYDLTLIFGSGNEPSTVADALAQLPALGLYNAYDAGSLVSTEVSGVRSVGKNILEPMTQTTPNGTYSDGTYTSNTRVGASAWVGKVDVSKYTSVIIALDSVLNGNFGYGLSNDDVTGSENIVSKCPNNATSNTVLSTIGYKYLYLYFRTSSEGVTATLTKFRVNIGDTALAYTPYKTDTLSLSETVTLRSAGSVADTDELNVEVLVDGVKVNKRRQTTMVGSYTFTGQETLTDLISSFGRVDFSGLQSSVKGSTENALMAGFEVTTAGQTVSPSTYNRFAIASDGRVLIQIPSQTTVAGYLSYLTGKTIYFELATESVTLLDPIIENFIEVEGGSTIDTIQEQSPVIDNCLDVGYLTL